MSSRNPQFSDRDHYHRLPTWVPREPDPLPPEARYPW